MKTQFHQIQQHQAEAIIQLDVTPEVLDCLGEPGFSPQFGARPLKWVLQRLILNELSKDAVVEAVLEDGAVKVENVELPTVSL
jgi:ATP-dependent Clp protease ATP-binding subunit ClpB